MKNLITGLFIIALAVSAAPACFGEVTTDGSAPDFSLTDTKGAVHTLSAYRGKMVVLEWTNYDCPFVKKHYDSGNMQALQQTYASLGVVWLSVNSSAPGKQGNYPAEEWNKMIQAKGSAATAVLLDGDGTVGRMYGAVTTPHMFVINPEGVLIYQGAIDDNPSPDPAVLAESTNYVAAALDEALAGKPVSVSSAKSYGCSVKY